MNFEKIITATKDNVKDLEKCLKLYNHPCFTIAVVLDDGTFYLSKTTEELSRSISEQKKNGRRIILDKIIIENNKDLKPEKVDFHFRLSSEFCSNPFGLSSFIEPPFEKIEKNVLWCTILGVEPRYLKLFPQKIEPIGMNDGYKLVMNSDDYISVPIPPDIR